MRPIDKPERNAEDKLVKELEKIGVWAYHVDTSSINGFPDLMVHCCEIQQIEMKHRKAGTDPLLLELLQSSQPVYWKKAEDSGNPVLLCVAASDGTYSLYNTLGVLRAMARGTMLTLSDMDCIHPSYMGIHANEMAQAIKDVCDVG